MLRGCSGVAAATCRGWQACRRWWSWLQLSSVFPQALTDLTAEDQTFADERRNVYKHIIRTRTDLLETMHVSPVPWIQKLQPLEQELRLMLINENQDGTSQHVLVPTWMSPRIQCVSRDYRVKLAKLEQRAGGQKVAPQVKTQLVNFKEEMRRVKLLFFDVQSQCPAFALDGTSDAYKKKTLLWCHWTVDIHPYWGSTTFGVGWCLPMSHLSHMSQRLMRCWCELTQKHTQKNAALFPGIS